MNKFDVIYLLVTSYLLSTILWNDGYSWNFKFFYLWLSSCLTLLLVLFELKMDEIEKEKMEEVEKT